mmetsp:Transcript_34304/g.79323  ORF Transcript_34304/g.79323 Transcript_34304/m.79323 type:complete len:340 (+) Transcript_34304:713-1732(+)
MEHVLLILGKGTEHQEHDGGFERLQRLFFVLHRIVRVGLLLLLLVAVFEIHFFLLLLRLRLGRTPRQIHLMIVVAERKGILLVPVILRHQVVVGDPLPRHPLLRQRLLVHLVRHDGRPHEISLEQGQPHLLQDEIDLAPFGNAPVRLHVHVLHRVRRPLGVPRPLQDPRQPQRQLRPLLFQIDPPVRQVPQQPRGRLHLGGGGGVPGLSRVVLRQGPRARGHGGGDGRGLLAAPGAHRLDAAAQGGPAHAVLGVQDGGGDAVHHADEVGAVVAEPAFLFGAHEEGDGVVQSAGGEEGGGLGQGGVDVGRAVGLVLETPAVVAAGGHFGLFVTKINAASC